MNYKNIFNDLDAIGLDISKVSLLELQPSMLTASHAHFLVGDMGKEHYKLLAYLSTLFVDSVIFDVGTHLGTSSIAMSYGGGGVISYDIKSMKNVNPPSNVEYKIGDFRKDPEVLNSPLIFIDVDPHDGKQEQQFHEFFLESGYSGIVLWDDILDNRGISHWWKSLQHDTKLDISSVGHWSGTGVVVYGS
jgi:hypothetical protein